MTRVERARRKVRIAQTAIGIGAAAGLAVFAGLARSSHPATHHARSGSVSNQPAAQESNDDGDSFFYGSDDDNGSSNVGPSGSAAPQVQSGGS